MNIKIPTETTTLDLYLRIKHNEIILAEDSNEDKRVRLHINNNNEVKSITIE